MAAPYPARDSHFAHKFVRVLHKSCAAQVIGRDACYMLCVISHTEDAAHYSGPARFWNSQLMETLGFSSPKQLNNARDRAVAAGWLTYDRGGTRSVGEYFVTIPERFNHISDAPIVDSTDELILSSGGTNQGHNDQTILSPAGMNDAGFVPPGERKGDELRNEKVTESGKPSIPIPIPNTFCTELPLAASEPTSPPGSSKKKKPVEKLDIEAIEFPDFPCVPAKAGDGCRIWRLTEKHLDELAALNPAVDVRHEAHRALRWLKDNPRKIKTPDGMPRFISNWMKAEQNKGGSRGFVSANDGRPPREITRPVKRQHLPQEAHS